MNQITHGINGYKKHRCRCEICREANARSQRRYSRLQRSNILPSVSVEVWTEVWEEIRSTPFSITELYKIAGIRAAHFLGSAKRGLGLRASTFEKLKAGRDIVIAEMAKRSELYDNSIAPSDDESGPTPERIKSIKAFNKVFRYFRYAGFTMETLAERLDITPDELQSFIDSKYEDRTIAIRAARLHWIISRGDDEEEEENGE